MESRDQLNPCPETSSCPETHKDPEMHWDLHRLVNWETAGCRAKFGRGPLRWEIFFGSNDSIGYEAAECIAKFSDYLT